MKKKFKYVTILLIVFIFLFIYNFYGTNKNLNSYLHISKQLNELELLNKDLDFFINSKINFINFDKINIKIRQIKNIQKKLSKYAKKDKNLQNLFNKIDLKLVYIEQYKSKIAIVNNSFRFIYKLLTNTKKHLAHDVYLKIIMSSYFNKPISKNIINNKNLDKLYLTHLKILIDHYIKLYKIRNKINSLQIKNFLNSIKTLYIKSSLASLKKARFGLFFSGIILGILFVIFLYLVKLIEKEKKLLNRFKKAVENNYNVIVVTNKDLVIKYVNNAFSKIYGYTKKEVIGKKIDIIKSRKHSSKFYKNLKDTIYSGKIWVGEFINKAKDGHLVYEKASISPIFDEKGNIVEFLAVKLDITDTIKQQLALREKERLLLQQSKMATMGEMIGNIAHQWRQPLSSISTLSTGMVLQKELGLLDDEQLVHNLEKITGIVKYLSQTIDDFRNFYKQDKEVKTFYANEIIKKIKELVGVKYKSLGIKFIENIENIELKSYQNELLQVIINIINNAKDILVEKNLKNKLIFINIYQKENFVYFEICDNGGGISENIKDKIFEAYFTTKHQSQGTGIGLYMTYQIVTNNLKGEIWVENLEYGYNNEKYTGAKFIVKIPQNLNNEKK